MKFNKDKNIKKCYFNFLVILWYLLLIIIMKKNLYMVRLTSVILPVIKFWRSFCFFVLLLKVVVIHVLVHSIFLHFYNAFLSLFYTHQTNQLLRLMKSFTKQKVWNVEDAFVYIIGAWDAHETISTIHEALKLQIPPAVWILMLILINHIHKEWLHIKSSWIR